MEKTYGVRWSEFDRQNRLSHKEKFFKSDKARIAFCDKLEEKDNFNEFTAWYEGDN